MSPSYPPKSKVKDQHLGVWETGMGARIEPEEVLLVMKVAR